MSETPAERRPDRVTGSSSWEDEYGFARAVAAGDFVLVSGSTAVGADGVVQHEGDPYGQTLAAFGTARAALERFGLTLADVVRTRTYVTHVRDCDEVVRAHKSLFDQVRPAATMVVVAGLADPRALVEVELDAHRAGLAGTRAGLAGTSEALEGNQP
ncbi:RidA family protein [Kitasatospora sp. NPDC093806]|uniref:RidA family protein n=1 Tax=Kitasatospora sp. NPDC093806 TaxID=3155075 RepID=UPI00344518CE